jgi:hypothetical protein
MPGARLQQVAFAQLLAQAGGALAQHLVAGTMAMAVIDDFEMVDVDGDQAARCRLLLGQQMIDVLLQATPVAGACQWVLQGHHLDVVQQLLLHDHQITKAESTPCRLRKAQAARLG